MASALSSLTNTYTDSEGEEGPSEELPRRDASSSPLDDGVHQQQTQPATTARPPRGRMHLVSYGDDTVLSDDEGDKNNSGSSVVILMPPRPATPAFPSQRSPSEAAPAAASASTAAPSNENGALASAAEPSPNGQVEPKPEPLPVFTDVEMPPEPVGSCTFELQQKIYDLTDKMQTRNVDMNTIIQQRKAFRNPSIYEKLIQFCNINEFGTNYEPSIYDPLKWGKDSYFDELAKIQKQDMDQREKDRREKTTKRLQQVQVEFVVGTKRSTNGSGAVTEEEVKKRKSKWDQVGTLASHGVKPPVTTGIANLTTSVTGTKGTVISAFGSLPKKPKI
ncbi:SAP30-binding protein [Cimex lectularius]|uniref:SAP30-binding protein n=1 Tax=Cimex lectularius TaxID=79782 RepID=A0A8I6S4L2_CIMLE|nr:SAP30-binding protein [Cimex lectularius]